MLLNETVWSTEDFLFASPSVPALTCSLVILTAAVDNQDAASRKGARNFNFIIVAAHPGPAAPPGTPCSAELKYT